MIELLSYDFFINAILAATFTSISCGIVGTYIVSRRIVFISGGITHSSFGGIGIAYFLGFNPLLGAAVFSMLSALGIELFSKRSEIREDSAIAIFWSFGMAIGIIFIYLSPGYAPNLMSYLFGSILTVTGTEVMLSALLTVFVTVFFVLFLKPILYLSFDNEFLKTKKLSVGFFNYIIMGLIALTIVLSIKIARIILIISLLTIPQATANIFTRNYSRIIGASIAIGFVGSMSGLFFAYSMDIPSGASIIFTLIALFVLAKLGFWLTSQPKKSPSQNPSK